MLALRSVVEVAVHVDNFRNIDLFHQGYYRLRLRIRHGEDQAAGAVAHVVKAWSAESAAGDWVTMGNGVPAATTTPAEGGPFFHTQSMLIKYCEEQVTLNDMARFRFEFDLEAEGTFLVLDVDLMYMEATYGPGKERYVSLPSEGDAISESFTAVASQSLRVNGIMDGIHAYCPVLFDEMHFCQVGLMVHASLVDYRMRLGLQEAGKEARHAAERILGGGLAKAIVEVARRFEVQDAKDTGCIATEPQHAIQLLRDALASRLSSAQASIAKFLGRLQAPDSDQVGEAAMPAQTRNNGHESDMILGATAGSNSGTDSLGEPSTDAETGRLLHALTHSFRQEANRLMATWRSMLEAISVELGAVGKILRADWEARMLDVWRESVFHAVCPVSSLASPGQDVGRAHANAAAALRRLPSYVNREPLPLEDMSLFSLQEVHPVLFEQRYSLPPQSQDSTSNHEVPLSEVGPMAGPRGPNGRGRQRLPSGRVHLFVLVHGFQGAAFDMRLLRNNIALRFPDSLFLCSTANEEETEGDIGSMGMRLAEEVRSYVQDWCPGPPELTLGALSFVAHSVGGLIVRSALPHLEVFRDLMFSYISLSSPHLGCVCAANSLFKTGLWVIKTLRHSDCLEQLSMTDTPMPSDCFLSRLSESPGLDWFEHVVLVSSYQDQYTPFESARIESCKTAESNHKIGPVYTKMVQNILDRLDASRIARIDIDFHMPEANLDTVIGRAAHIHFIENQLLMQMFVSTQGHLFG